MGPSGLREYVHVCVLRLSEMRDLFAAAKSHVCVWYLDAIIIAISSGTKCTPATGKYGLRLARSLGREPPKAMQKRRFPKETTY